MRKTNKEKPGTCERCEKRGLTVRFQGERICMDCLLVDEDPLTLERFMYAPSNFAEIKSSAVGHSAQHWREHGRRNKAEK